MENRTVMLKESIMVLLSIGTDSTQTETNIHIYIYICNIYVYNVCLVLSLFYKARFEDP